MEEVSQGEALRYLMRHVPSPVTVVTCHTDEGARGVTIGSFTSVSLEPPLVCFNVMEGGTSHSDLISADRFAIHILRDDQAAISNQFATKGYTSEQQFNDVPYHLDENNLPILEGALGVLVCERYDVMKAGDHSLILGMVVGTTVNDSGNPLLYYQRSYHSVGEPV